MELHAPVDFERLPEFWQLCDSLRARARTEVAPRTVEQAANFVWWRLWVTLAYSAKRTNRPGWLNEADARRLAQSVDPLFGDSCPVLEVLTDGVTPLLAKVADGHDCALFREYNAHLAGNHVPREIRGNLRSRFNAALPAIGQAAVHQALLLPPEIFKDRAGNTVEQREVERCMNLILRLDRALLIPGTQPRQRRKGDYTEGLIADAVEVVRRQVPEPELLAWLHWLLEKRDSPALPKSAEELLRDFDKYFPPPKDNP